MTKARRRGFLAAWRVVLAILSVAEMAGRAANRQIPTPAPSPAAVPSFEVASIKPGQDQRAFAQFNWSRLTVSGKPVKWLIAFAYAANQPMAQLNDNLIVGGPSWIATATYSIDAKVDDATAEKLRERPMGEIGVQIRLMTQSLLADRFNLKVHHEARERPIYALEVAKGGPKFLATRFIPQPGATTPLGPGGKPLPPAPAGIRQFWLRGPVKNLAGLLAGFPAIGRPVIDETGIEGNFEFVLRVPADQLAAANRAAADNIDSALPPDSSEPSVFMALEEQLGLKLKGKKGSTDVVVLDSIDRPTEN